jgi:hypothetical protein
VEVWKHLLSVPSLNSEEHELLSLQREGLGVG